LRLKGAALHNTRRWIAQGGISGIAFDGTNLYFEDGKGNVTKRIASPYGWNDGAHAHTVAARSGG